MLGRDTEMRKLRLLATSVCSPSSIFVVGPPQCGKTMLISTVLHEEDSNIHHATVSCLPAAIRVADIFQGILGQLFVGQDFQKTCSTFSDFVAILKGSDLGSKDPKPVVIVLRHADRLLRGTDALLLPGLLALRNLTGLRRLTIVLVSRLPWSRWKLTHWTATPPAQITVATYSRPQLTDILKASYYKHKSQDESLVDGFVEVVLSVFQTVCRSLPQFQRAAQLLWPEYVRPVEEKKVESDNHRALFRHVEPHLRRISANIHLREKSSQGREVDEKTKRLNVELPFFSKFLVLAAYLASYNPAKTDKRFFVKQSGRVKKSKRTIRKAAHQRSSQLLGPKAFDLNRMLAIFHVIVDQKVTSSAEILSQVASLVTLQMLAQVGDDLDTPKYKCNVGLDFVRLVSKNVRFELHKYLYDVDQ